MDMDVNATRNSSKNYPPLQSPAERLDQQCEALHQAMAIISLVVYSISARDDHTAPWDTALEAVLDLIAGAVTGITDVKESFHHVTESAAAA
jgi:hypothetical protein